MTTSERHGVIIGYLGVALSVIAVILSIVSMRYSYLTENREIIQISKPEDDGYYHFDGETLFKNYQVMVANNSAIPVSVVEITLERDGESRIFEASDLPSVLPLNLEANHSKMITIQWNINTSLENAQKIRDILSERNPQNTDSELERQLSEFDLKLPSKKSGMTFPEDSIQRLGDLYHKPDNRLDSSIFNSKFLDMELITEVIMEVGPIGGICDIYDFQEILPLYVSIRTAKNNQYFSQADEMGVPTSSSLTEDFLIVCTILEE